MEWPKFNIKLSPQMSEDLREGAEEFQTTKADIIREALSLFFWVAREFREDSHLLIQRGDEVTELVIPSLEELRRRRAKQRRR